jgi:hypothetical protein
MKKRLPQELSKMIARGRCFNFLFLSLLISFLSVQCIVKELDDQMYYSFIERDFQSLGGLPDLQDNPLAVEDPLLPLVTQSEIAARMFQNLDRASEPGDLSQETKTNLSLMRKTEGFSSPNIRQLMLNTIKGLDENELRLVYFGMSSLDATITGAVKPAMTNPRFMDLFPKIIHPETLPVANTMEIRKPEYATLKVNPSNKGKCAEEAKFALDRAIKRLEEKRDEQLAQAESNFQLRLSEADERLILRNLEAEKNYLKNLDATAKEVDKILKAAHRVEGRDPALAEELRLMALTYAYAWQLIFQEEFQAALEANEMAREHEINESIIRKQQLELDIIQNYNSALDNAIATLERVLAACHNQGGGN